MPEFLSPIDIGNRAAQHCGVTRMDATLGFTEQSKTASEIGFVYGKLRRAELQRNAWRFSIKKAALRPIDLNTMLVLPALWVSNTTYFKGSIVADQSGTAWQSTIPNNTGNQPGTIPAQSGWRSYFGPLTASLYDSTVSYYAGEIVYTAAGNGTWNVFESLTTGNAVHPALPDQWAVGTTYYKNQVVQQFAAWSSGTTYGPGVGVLYTDGNYYVSLVGSNLNHIPPSSASQWALLPVLTLTTPTVPASQSTYQLPGSSPVLEWSSTQAYTTGNVVMFNATEYVAIAASTGQYPNAAGSTYWAAVTGGTLYMSLTDLNIGNTPSASPAPWAIGTTYASGTQVAGSDGLIYTSAQNGNVGHDPTLDGTHTWWTATGTLVPWTTTFTQGGGNSQWLQIGGAAFPSGVGLATLDIANYPLGSGPVQQAYTRNVYRLPAGFLRKAPQDPKAGSDSWLGAPENLVYDDWLFEGNYIVSASSYPILLRFVADVQSVVEMDDMFCEGLGARIAQEVVEPLTQSTAKLEAITAVYEKKMGEARARNAILIGSEEPPLDDFLACRR